MKFLLLNDNPVVNKLVTLSAQKTGDELVVSKAVDEITDGKYDLLIVDHAIYTNALLDILSDRISYRRSLFIASRSEEVPDAFDKVIHKPFLPTDLVEYFSTQLSEEEAEVVEETSEEEASDTQIDESLEDLDLDLDLLEGLPEIGDDEGLELDGDEMLLADVEELGLDDIEMDDAQEHDSEDDAEEGGVLDEDELLEVQGLLEDDESEVAEDDEDASLGLTQESMDEVNGALEELGTAEELTFDLEEEIEGLLLDEAEDEKLAVDEEVLAEGPDTLDELSESLDEEVLDAVASAGTPAEPIMDEMSLDDIALDDDEMIMDTSELEKIEEDEEETGLPDDDTALDELLDDESMGESEHPDEERAEEEEVSLELESDDETLDEELDEAIDMDAEVDIDMDDMEIIDEELENAVNSLSEEELEQEFDDGMLEGLMDEELEADEAASEDTTLGLDGLDVLNEYDLKVALGEDVQGFAAPGRDGLSSLMDGDDTELTVAASDEGVKALHELTKTLQNVLKDDASAAALKGMRINVNISFGEER